MILGSLINHPERLNRETLYELRSIVARYPYFQTARLLMLNNMYLMHDPDFGTELRRSVFYIADRRALCRLIEGRNQCIEPEEETITSEQPSVDRTLSLIDAFLDTLPEDTHTGQLIPDVVTDYVNHFLSDKEEEGILPTETASPKVMNKESQTDQAIDTIARALELAPQEEAQSMAIESPIPPTGDRLGDENSAVTEHEENLLDESYFTETLAKIYVKQQRYSKALEIIRKLNLNYPKKNAYFADQIRFLEKLIINNNLK